MLVAIIVSSSTQKSSLPSCRQRGCAPLFVEMRHFLSPSGNDLTYTSDCT